MEQMIVNVQHCQLGNQSMYKAVPSIPSLPITIAQQINRIGVITIRTQHWKVLSELICITTETMDTDDSWLDHLLTSSSTNIQQAIDGCEVWKELILL